MIILVFRLLLLFTLHPLRASVQDRNLQILGVRESPEMTSVNNSVETVNAAATAIVTAEARAQPPAAAADAAQLVLRFELVHARSREFSLAGLSISLGRTYFDNNLRLRSCDRGKKMESCELWFWFGAR